MWERLRTGSKTGFDKTWQALDKLGAPVNKLSNKLGSEAFWPTTLDKESDKAARILRSFCKDGFYGEEEVQPAEGPKMKQRVLQKIPERVMKNAKGLAIFTTMRTGLWMSGSGGSGVLVARLPDGSWSPPSGILMHTAGLGFMVGIDIYDCVIVINDEKALEGFTKVRCTLGAEMSVAAGPVGAGGVLDSEVHKRRAPIYTYLKSRGFYAGVQIDGTIVIERTDENERFYHEKIPVKDILAGKVRHPPYELKMLMETLKAAEGSSDYDASMLPTEAPPSDFEIDHGDTFGVPDKDDPDPYGVLALEKEGMSLKEAGTSKRASWEQFQFNPSPTSPVHTIVSRKQSSDLSRPVSRRSSWRTSALSNENKAPSSLRNSMSVDRPPSQMCDSSTQTDFPVESNPPSPTQPSHRINLADRSNRASMSSSFHSHMQNVPENEVLEAVERHEPPTVTKVNGYTTPPSTPPPIATVHIHPEPANESDHEIHEEDEAIEEPVVQTIQQAQRPSAQVVSKARLVTVAKRVPPKLPPRNPSRVGALSPDLTLQSTKSSESLVSPSSGSIKEPASPLLSADSAVEIARSDSASPSPVEEKLAAIILEDHESTVKSPSMETKRTGSTMPGGFE